MRLVVEKNVELDEARYAERLIEDLYELLECDEEDWNSLSEDQRAEFVVSTFETALQRAKGERA